MNPIRKIALFAPLPDAAVKSILSCAEERTFRRRQPLFRQGDRLTGLFVLRAGNVKLSQIGRSGDEVIMRLAGAGEAIAAVAAFEQPERFPVGASALGEVAALFWERPVAQRLGAEFPLFAAGLAREISRQAHGFQLRLREVATERVPQRLARLLLQLAEKAGVRSAEGVRIDIPLTRQELAQMTGTTLYSVSRLLSEWAGRGLVLAARARITVCSRRGLRQAVGIESDGP